MYSVLLADLPEEDVRAFVRTARRRRFSRGEVVFHGGDAADSVHLIEKGRFAVRLVSTLGDSLLVAIHGAGGAFGELAAFQPGSTRSATVSALEEGETLSVYQDDFVLLQQRHPSVNQVLLRLIAAQLRHSNERLLEAHFLDAGTRVLRRLHDVASLYGPGVGGRIRVPLTQTDLAQLAGTSRATVNRVLRAEEGRGTLELRRGAVVVDGEALHARAALARRLVR